MSESSRELLSMRDTIHRESVESLVEKYKEGTIGSLVELRDAIEAETGVKTSTATLQRSLCGTWQRGRRAGSGGKSSYFLKRIESGIRDDLLKQYEEGFIKTLSELKNKIKDATGVDIPLGALSRYLTSKASFKSDKIESNNHIPLMDVSMDFKNDDILGTSSSEVRYRSLSRRLQKTILTIGEEGGVRQYQRFSMSSNGSREYFRCLFCVRCRRKSGGGVVAHLTVYQGRIVGNMHPQHHEHCQPITEEQAAIQALDRESRKEVRTGQKTPKDAHAVGFQRAVQLAGSCSCPPGRKLNMPTMFPSWRKVCRSYYRARKLALREQQTAATNDPADTEDGMSPREGSIEKMLSSKMQNSVHESTEATNTFSESSSHGQAVCPSVSIESIKVDSSMTDDSVDEVLASLTSPSTRIPSSVGEDQPECAEISEKKFHPTENGTTTPPTLCADISSTEYGTSHTSVEDTVLLENNSTYTPTTSGAFAKDCPLPTSSRNVSTFVKVKSNIQSINDQLTSTEMTSEGPSRHRVLMRDLRTGRLIVKERLPPGALLSKVVVRRRQTSTLPIHSKRESIFGRRIVTLNDDDKRTENLKRKAATPLECNSNSLTSNSIGLSKRNVSISPQLDIGSPIRNSVQLLSSPERCNWDLGSRHNGTTNTISALELLFDKVGKASKDQYDTLADSMADCLRRVYNENADIGVKFKCELLHMMAKYETLTFAK